MTDRELLEAAAKAADIDGWWSGNDYCFGHNGNTNVPVPWRPLTDDGDALRLVAKLNLNIEYLSEPDGPEVWISDTWSDTVVVQAEPLGKDPMTATRRAIVRAAAQIGKVMPCA